jgi:hypothetical protein
MIPGKLQKTLDSTPVPARYCGFGDAAAPAHVLERMQLIAGRLRLRGWTLRTGAAPGCESAFAAGAGHHKEVVAPELLDARHGPTGYRAPNKAWELAEAAYPRWWSMSLEERATAARHVHMLLGFNLDRPVNAIIHWSADDRGDRPGRMANSDLRVKLAAERFIPIINLADTLPLWVANSHHKLPDDEIRSFHIGRPSVLGNPFPIATPSQRAAVIERYGKWLWRCMQEEDHPVMDELVRIVTAARQGPVRLVCSCAPMPCHGDMVVRACEWLDRRVEFSVGTVISGRTVADSHGESATVPEQATTLRH